MLTQSDYVSQATMLVRILRSQWRVVIDGEIFLSDQVGHILRS